MRAIRDPVDDEKRTEMDVLLRQEDATSTGLKWG